jgi:hypothetical protein
LFYLLLFPFTPVGSIDSHRYIANGAVGSA